MGGSGKIGWIFFQTPYVPCGCEMDITADLVSMWFPRKQQIYAAEAFAAVAAPIWNQSRFEDVAVRWFCDNEAAVSSLIRGGSRTEDVEEVAVAAHLLFQSLGAQVWFEWIDSDSNPADGLFRGGVSDEWTAKQCWHLTALPPREWHSVFAAYSVAGILNAKKSERTAH